MPAGGPAVLGPRKKRTMHPVHRHAARVGRWLGIALSAAALLSTGATASAQTTPAAPTGQSTPNVPTAPPALPGPLVSAEWLQQHLGRPGLVVIDASPGPERAGGHIPGSLHFDPFARGDRDPSLAEWQQRLRAWGLSSGQRVVLIDGGGTYFATRVWFDFVHRGWPRADVALLDGGTARWRATGGTVTKEATAAPSPGNAVVTRPDESLRARLPEVLDASGRPGEVTLVDALEPMSYYGGFSFFDRAGHLPHAVLWPSAELFNADKTWKSPAEIRRMAAHLGLRPDKPAITYCGGGIAASAPLFALRELAGFGQTRLFVESQLAWVQDERQLPLWTVASPTLLRSTPWLKTWTNPMLRAFATLRVDIVDVRPAAAWQLGHLPFARHLPADGLRAELTRPDLAAAARGIADLAGAAGVDPKREAVIVADGGLTREAALAFVALELAGQQRSSIYLDSVERWAEQGNTVARPRPDAPAAGPTLYTAAPRLQLVAATVRGAAEADPKPDAYPVVIVDASAEPSKAAATATASNTASATPGIRTVHLPYTRLLGPDGAPLAAKDLWTTLDKAGLPRYAHVRVTADDPGAAAVAYVVLRWMGWPDVRVALR
jgi:3-mercaptopyruvate sulfurtransferase SseA